MVRRGTAVFALFLAAASPAIGRSGVATKYRPAYIFGGYREKEIDPGLWKISSGSNGIAESGFGRNMAAYRAAEILKAAGFSYLQVVNQKGETMTIGPIGATGSFAGEALVLWVRGANDIAAPLDCRALQAAACYTVEIAPLMKRLRPQLAIPAEAQ